MQTTDNSPARPVRAGWFGHPAGLARLFSIEMWERMGFYGMRVLLTLYLTKHFVLGDHAATGLYGGYTALVYLTPIAGGLVADQYLGAKMSVRFGAVLMAIGYFAMAFGGSPAKPTLIYDGAVHTVVIENFRDSPTSAANERRLVIDHGRALAIVPRADGGVALTGADGHLARLLPSGSAAEGSRRDEGRMTVLLLALAMIAVGNGFFKPNISTMVGALYESGDARRDAGFTIFYMGINLGSILGQFLCPVLADHWGWGAGFGTAGLGMLLAGVLVSRNDGMLTGLGEPPPRAGSDQGLVIGMLALATVPVFAWGLGQVMEAPGAAAAAGLAAYLAALPVMGKLLFGSFVLGVPAILLWTFLKGSRQEFRMMLAAMVLITFNTTFWTLFEQAGSSLTLFADRNTNRSIFGLFEISAPQTQNFNSISIVVLAPLASLLWAWLARRGREPSIPVKFAMALIAAGASFLLLVLGSRFAGPDARVSIWWLAGLYVTQSAAELLISPVGLSMITKLAVARLAGLMMGMWFLSLAVGEYVAGMVAQVASVETVGGAIADPALSLATYVRVFTVLGWTAMMTGGLLLALASPLRRLMHGVS